MAHRLITTSTLLLLSATTDIGITNAEPVELGEFVTRQHLTAGLLVAHTDRRLEIQDFVYDGLGPAAFFWGDPLQTPSSEGYLLEDEASCGKETLGSYNGMGSVFLEIPTGMTLADFANGSISVWCEQFSVNFGEVVIPADVSAVKASDGTELTCSEAPSPLETTVDEPVELGEFMTRQHLTAGLLVAHTDRRLEIRDFVYDGLGPAAFFWGDSSQTPTSNGYLLKDEGSCGEQALGAFDGSSSVFLEIPSGMTLADYANGSISVWCEQFAVNFGEAVIPADVSAVKKSDGTELTCASEEPPKTEDPVELGEFVTRSHLTAGLLVAHTDRRLEIRDFVYDGLGPAAFFWGDSSQTPTSSGYLLQDVDSCGDQALGAFDGSSSVFLEIPSGMTLADYANGSISVWCEQFAVNFGEVVIPADVSDVKASDGTELTCSEATPPPGDEPVELGKFVTRSHLTAGLLVAHTDRRLEIRDFVYDGLGPAAFFWGDTNSTPTSDGYLLKDEDSCGEEALGAFEGSSSVFLEIPSGMTLANFAGGSISVWCEQFAVNFGEVEIPADVSAVKVSDGTELKCGSGPIIPDIAKTPTNFNCEPLNEDFQVRWAVEGDDLAVELVGRIDEMSYLSFGPSGRDDRTFMTGSDVVVADMFQGEFRAVDYYMSSRAQCSNGNGVCPDTETANLENGISNVSGEREFGLTLVRYKRPLEPKDVEETVGALGEPVDRAISTVGPTYISWAIGPISTDTGFANFHSIAFSRDNVTLDFGREIADNCSPLVKVDDENAAPTTAPEVAIVPFARPVLSDVTEFTARIGPSGGNRGYQAITGRTAWGISWYINDLLIPEIVMKRGTKYTFLINGGNDPTQDNIYHPFYLTTSIEGGYAQVNASQRMLETPLAGIVIEEQTEEGVIRFKSDLEAPICQYQSTLDTSPALQDPETTYEDFFGTLDTSCEDDASIVNNAVILEFTPDETTPDVIYYHCVTHKNLGWKIKVEDADSEPPSPPTPAPSMRSPTSDGNVPSPTSEPTTSGAYVSTKNMLVTALSLMSTLLSVLF